MNEKETNTKPAAEPCTITLSYHNSQTGQTATATYEIGAPDENNRCASDLTLSWKNAAGEGINLGEFEQDHYGIAGKFVKVLLAVQGQPGVKVESSEFDLEDL